MLAAQDTAEPLGQLERSFRERSHRAHAVGCLQVDEWTDMEAAGASVGVEGRLRTVFRDETKDLADILGQVLDRNRDVLDTRDRLVVAPDTVEQAESGFAHCPDVSLALPIADGDGVPSELALLDELDQRLELVLELGFGLSVVLDHEEGFRVAPEESDAVCVSWLLAGEPDEQTVHQLDC